MADPLVKWVYPPNWDYGLPGDGEDAGVNALYGKKRYILQVDKYIAATEDESNFKLVDISLLRSVGGNVAVRSVIEKVEYQIFGVNIRLFWESTPANEIICNIGSTGVESDGCIKGPMIDPRTGDGTDGSGDILLTTVDGAAKDSYHLKIYMRMKDNVRPDINM
jgi:hypothetical protein